LILLPLELGSDIIVSSRGTTSQTSRGTTSHGIPKSRNLKIFPDDIFPESFFRTTLPEDIFREPFPESFFRIGKILPLLARYGLARYAFLPLLARYGILPLLAKYGFLALLASYGIGKICGRGF